MESGRYTWSAKPKNGKGISRKASPNSITFLYTNAQSLINKIDELRIIASDLKPDIILISESWTHKDITKAYLSIQGYELQARKDRSDTIAGRGGGILVYNRSDMIVNEIELTTPFNEVMTIKISTDSKPLLFNLIYR